ncbi:MAG: hypothetical protein IT445_00455 [Phycisphaeraceae bacterium]|nr:hypothetical protein [Phycisphaeraceae bacterium]
MHDEKYQHLTLAQAFPDYNDVVEEVISQKAFQLNMLWPECRQTTIKMLLEAASQAYVFGARRNSRYGHLLSGILIPEQGKHRLDLLHDCITDRDGLWACGFTCWTSLIVVVPNEPQVIEKILSTCYGPWILANWRGDHTRGAMKLAASATQSTQHVVFCLQGIEYMDVTAYPDVLIKYLHYVATHCILSKPDSWRYGPRT